MQLQRMLPRTWKRPRKNLLPEPSEGAWPFQNLDFGLLAEFIFKINMFLSIIPTQIKLYHTTARLFHCPTFVQESILVMSSDHFESLKGPTKGEVRVNNAR